MPPMDCFLEVDDLPGIIVRNITIIRGDDSQFAITYRDPLTLELIDWTGWTFAAKAKATIDGVDWSDAVVSHNGTGGKVLVTWPKVETELLVPDAVGVWDLQGTDPGGLVHTITRGTATVVGDVTGT